MKPATLAEHPGFQRLMDGLGGPLVLSTPRSFDLVFEGGLPVTVSLHPNDLEVAIDVWCYDAAPHRGVVRRNIVKSLLMLNQAALADQAVRIGMDTRGLILLHGSQVLEGLQGNFFLNWLTQLVEQGRRIRTLLNTYEEEPDSEMGPAYARGPLLH
ncbi:MAG: type III secretion system chaperone [Comamonadaceae bacterium]|nr:type III secretion system chaperone [Comamonadaceae bacterium]